MNIALLQNLVCFALINFAIIMVGFLLLKYRQVFLSWLILAAGIVAVYLVFINEHPILQMLAIIATTFSGMKVIAVTEGYKNKPLTLSFKQWVVYAIGWVGMRAQPFETLGQRALPGGVVMVKFGVSRIAAGGVLILIAHSIESIQPNGWVNYVIVTAFLLVGFSLILHFGFLSVSAGMWRFSGVNTYYLFRQPVKALSLTELWSKRWNIAFSEMTSVAIFRPLRKKIGPPAALMISFVFSGLLHELALSLPVNSGYGLPTLYFVIQGAMVLVERYLSGKKNSFLENKLVARIWVFFWLIVPMPLLFHAEFIKQVIWPLAGLHV